MRPTFSSVQTPWLVPWPLFAVLLLGSSLANAADPPAKEKSDSKESRVQFRAYLPVTRYKALLENERRSVSELKKCDELYRVYVEGGLIRHVQSLQIQAEVPRGRIQLLRRDTD